MAKYQRSTTAQTPEQREERVAFTLTLLKNPVLTKGEIKARMRNRFGLTVWQIEPLLREARSRLIWELTGKPLDEYLAWVERYYSALACGEEPGPRPPYTGRQLARLLALNGARPRAHARAREP
jgi:hypothetical protein